MATYQSGIQWLNEKSPFFMTLVINLGKPVEDMNIPTAAIRCAKGKYEDFEVAYNPEYFSGLTDEEAGGVLGHEALHAVLDHLKESNDPKFENKMACIISHEVICNDRLANEGFLIPGKPYYGPETIGEDTSPMTTEEVYDLVVEKMNQEKEQQDKGDTPNTNENGSSTGDSEPSENNSEESESNNNSSGIESLGVAICGHSRGDNNIEEKSDNKDNDSNEMTPEDWEKLREKLVEAVKNADFDLDKIPVDLREEIGLEKDSVTKSDMSGNGLILSAEQVAANGDMKVAWVKLLEMVNPDILRKPGKRSAQYRTSWHSPRRKLAHMGQSIMVPNHISKGNPDKNSREGNNKPFIVIALDTSSSIPLRWVKKLQEIAKSVPDDLIEVRCCTFSINYVPFDINKEKNVIAKGGTDFSAVESFIRQLMKNENRPYPSAVVVFTDGEAIFRNMTPKKEQLKDNWNWLLIEGSYGIYDKNVPLKKIHQAKDFI